MAGGTGRSRPGRGSARDRMRPTPSGLSRAAAVPVPVPRADEHIGPTSGEPATGRHDRSASRRATPRAREPTQRPTNDRSSDPGPGPGSTDRCTTHMTRYRWHGSGGDFTDPPRPPTIARLVGRLPPPTAFARANAHRRGETGSWTNSLPRVANVLQRAHLET